MAKQRTGALILAAGLSSRMEEFKPLLEIGGKPLIEHAVALFKNSGIDAIVTVVGYRSADLIPVVVKTGSRYVTNGNYQDGMFSSVQRGAQVLQDTCDAFYLLPVDIPLVRPATLMQLQDKFNMDSSTLVCYPQYKSRRGHPPLIESSLINEILVYDGEGGMRGFLKQYEKHALEVPVDDAFTRMDADTIEDFSLLQRAFEKDS